MGDGTSNHRALLSYCILSSSRLVLAATWECARLGCSRLAWGWVEPILTSEDALALRGGLAQSSPVRSKNWGSEVGRTSL